MEDLTGATIVLAIIFAGVALMCYLAKRWAKVSWAEFWLGDFK